MSLVARSTPIATGDAASMSSYGDHEEEHMHCFSAEKEQLYEKRFENGYDLYTNNSYVKWLRLYHPESCSIDTVPDTSSVVAQFSDLTPEEPIAVIDNSISIPIAAALVEKLHIWLLQLQLLLLHLWLFHLQLLHLLTEMVKELL